MNPATLVAAPADTTLMRSLFSIGFLALLGVLNIGAVLAAEPHDLVHPVGLKGRWLGSLARVGHPAGAALVGALFALSFDTVSQAALFAMAGVQAGGRTGLTAIVVGLLFLLAIFFSPVAAMVPAYAAAGALIYVGVLMCSELTRVKWEDLTEAVPAFMTAVMMPFSFSITEGIAVGFISYCVMKAGTGRWREINPCVLVVALLFVLKFVWVDSH